jgi:hypothetical protein
VNPNVGNPTLSPGVPTFPWRDKARGACACYYVTWALAGFPWADYVGGYARTRCGSAWRGELIRQQLAGAAGLVQGAGAVAAVGVLGDVQAVEHQLAVVLLDERLDQ